jgi:hypothetical protein
MYGFWDWNIRLFSIMLHMHTANIIPFDLVIVITFNEEYILWRSSSCNSLQTTVSCSLTCSCKRYNVFGGVHQMKHIPSNWFRAISASGNSVKIRADDWRTRSLITTALSTSFTPLPPHPLIMNSREKVTKEGQEIARGKCGHQTNTAPAKSLRSKGVTPRMLALPLYKRSRSYRPKFERNEKDFTEFNIFIGNGFK